MFSLKNFKNLKSIKEKTTTTIEYEDGSIEVVKVVFPDFPVN